MKGLAEKITVTDISELKQFIQTLRPNHALTYGITEHEKARIVTKKALPRAQKITGYKLPFIARDRDHFTWPGPGIMPFDFDGFKADHPDEIFNLLVELDPVFKMAPMVIMPSASSGLYHGDECLKGLTGWRALVLDCRCFRYTTHRRHPV